MNYPEYSSVAANYDNARYNEGYYEQRGLGGPSIVIADYGAGTKFSVQSKFT